MVDIVLHKQLCPPVTPAEEEVCIPQSSLSQMENHSRGFFLLLPSKIMGFSMQTKRWGKSKQQLFSLYTAIKTF
jgi:hypothetical protein